MAELGFESLLGTQAFTSALQKLGWNKPTPIQSQSIPEVLTDSDVLAVAMTGSGKTGAYLLPTILKLQKNPKVTPRRPHALVLVPTRELAQQVGQVFDTLAEDKKLSSLIVYGGVGYARQRKSLAAGVHLLAATPGRLIDLMDQGHCLLDKVQVLVLDEADRMLDMGFQPAIETIVAKLPSERQSLFFSATFPPPARRLATSLLNQPKEVMVDAPSTTVREVDQWLMPVTPANKQNLLYDLLAGEIKQHKIPSALVFANSRVQAGRVTRYLARRGLAVAPIHGGMSQTARDEVLETLKQGSIVALIATDVLARGIDVESLSFVINYDVPLTVEAYVHRIGRTARAGKFGVSLTFVSQSEIDQINDVQRHIGQTIKQDVNHPYFVELKANTGPRRRKATAISSGGMVTEIDKSIGTSQETGAGKGTSERGVELKTKKTRSGKTITVEYKAGSRKRTISGKIRSGRSKRREDDKYKPAWKKRRPGPKKK